MKAGKGKKKLKKMMGVLHKTASRKSEKRNGTMQKWKKGIEEIVYKCYIGKRRWVLISAVPELFMMNEQRLYCSCLS